MPTIFQDYSKFNDVFKLDYCFDLSETSQAYKRNLELSNIDLVLLNKIAGENFHNEVRGGVNYNIIKTSHDMDLYSLEALDIFLNKITFSKRSETVFNTNIMMGGNTNQLQSILTQSNRILSSTPYKNYFGCNIGFSLNKSLQQDKDKIIESISSKQQCIDYLNPIKNLTTPSKKFVQRKTENDKAFMWSSKVLFLETQLLPTKARVVDIKNVSAKVLRMTAMLNKFENCIDSLGTDELLQKINIAENSINHAEIFLKNNLKDVGDFILNK